VKRSLPTAVAIGVMSFFVMVCSASAQEPACDPATPPAAKLVSVPEGEVVASFDSPALPSSLPAGRSVGFGVAMDFASGAEALADHVTVRGADGRVLFDGNGLESRLTVPVGRVVFQASWSEFALAGPSCHRIVQQVLSGIQSPPAKVTVLPFRSGEINFFVAASSDVDRCVRELGPQTVAVQIISGSSTATVSTADPCRPFHGGGARAGFGLTTETLTNLARFDSRWNSSGTHRLTYVVRLGGRVAERRQFTVRATVRRTPARRIFRGTDAFVNYCINHNQTIRSSGGRLYCTRPEQVRKRYVLDAHGLHERA
jgi:hypothetical protein